jgi:hypothetical protein
MAAPKRKPRVASKRKSPKTKASVGRKDYPAKFGIYNSEANYPKTNSEQAAGFMEIFQSFPGSSKPDYRLIERDILTGVYQYDASDHILTTQDGWMIRIEPGGRFIHC